MTADTLTPNLHLTKIAGDARNWTERMNGNLTLMDAVIGAFFTVQNLQGIWENSTVYVAEQTVVDSSTSVVWQCQVDHTSASIPTTFAEDRAAHATYWTVYSSPARARGAWTPSTSYAINDFVVSGSQYAICLQTHTSGAIFAADLASGKWSVLVDLSTAGSQVLPVPGGLADANKFVVTTPVGGGYTIVAASVTLDLLGFQTVGKAVAAAASQAAALSAIGAQAAGSYQTASSNLTAISSATLQPFGVALLGIGDAAGLRIAAELGTIATLSPSAATLAYLTTPATAAQATGGTNIASLGYVDRVAVQQVVSTITGAVATGTTIVPFDDTIPQNTEGDQYMSLSITPKSATSKLVIEVVANLSNAGAAAVVLALFQDATVNALAAVADSGANSGSVVSVVLRYVMVSGTISATTFKVRAGPISATTTTFNGAGGTRAFGGVMASSITIKEIGI